jgi:serine/threonine protein kinase
MPSPSTNEAFLELVRQAKVVDEKRLNARVLGPDVTLPEAPRQLAEMLVEDGLLTNYQAVLLLKGRTDGFRIGPYRIFERLGFGAVSNVYLCEHQGTHAQVAVKELTGRKAEDPVALKRFYREARASASLDHPNIVRVRDIDWDKDKHFIVMDFIDGSSVQDIVQHCGPMDVARAAHYIRQAAQGLQHAHQHGLVHRDIKPGNLLLDRQGTIKILDMGLARFSKEEGEALTQGEVLGTPEFFAPEQAIDSHNVDIRADIYSLGAVLYFMLAGEAPYSEEKTVARKILAKDQRPPKPIDTYRSDVPAELVALMDKTMARDPAQRFATPAELAEALKPWTSKPIAPPPDKEMPQLSRAALTKDAAPSPAPPPKPAAPRPAARSQPLPQPRLAPVQEMVIPTPAPRQQTKRQREVTPLVDMPTPAPAAIRARPKLRDMEEETEEPRPKRARKARDASGMRSSIQVIAFVVLVAATFAIAWILFNRQ